MHLSYSRVCEWAARFRGGRLSVEDDLRPGPEFKVRTDENIARIKAIVDEYPHCSIKDIAYESGISTGSVERILTIDLQMRKLCARWIPHKLTESQRLARLKMSKELLKEYSNADPRRLYEIFTGDGTWISYNEPERKSATCTWVGKNDDGSRNPPSKKARPDRFGRKVLYTIFFDAHGSVAQICLPKGQRVTREYYATTCLAAGEQHYKERRPRTICKGLRILHDNARPHKTRLVKDTLDSLGVVELQHPPYSPDLSLSVTSGCLTTSNCICLEEILRPTTSLEVPFSSISKPSPKNSTKKLFINGWSGWNSVFRIRGNILNI